MNETDSIWQDWIMSQEAAEALGWWIMWGIFAALLISLIIYGWYFFNCGVRLGEYLRKREDEDK